MTFEKAVLEINRLNNVDIVATSGNDLPVDPCTDDF